MMVMQINHMGCIMKTTKKLMPLELLQQMSVSGGTPPLPPINLPPPPPAEDEKEN